MSNATPSMANNVGVRLAEVAATMPEALAVAEPTGRKHGITQYRRMTFGELDRDSDQIAAGLRQMGIPAAARIVLLVIPTLGLLLLHAQPESDGTAIERPGGVAAAAPDGGSR